MSRNRRTSSLILLAAAVSVVFLLSGCQTLNWNEKWQSNFIDQMAVARDSQMLKNLVRMRYGNPPVFTTVGTVTEKYRQEPGRISLTGAVTSVLGSSADDSAKSENNLLGQVGIGGARETTLQYSPLTGEKLNKTMNQRLGLETVFDLTQSGFSIERVLAITVERFGPALNAPFASGPTPDRLPEREEFDEYENILAALTDLRQRSRIRFLNADPDNVCSDSAEARKEESRKELMACFLKDNDCLCEDSHDPQWKKLTDLLKIEDRKGVLVLTSAETSSETNEIKVSTRSLFGIMHYLSQNVKVPEGDREIVKTSEAGNGESCLREGRKRDGWDCSPAGKRFEIISSDTRPQLICSNPRTDGDCASVLTRHNGHWFYIDARDHESKSTFALLTKLFEIQISGRETNQGIFLVQ